MDTSRWAVNIMFFVNGFLYTNLVSRLPKIQDMYALSNGELGMTLMAASIGAVLAMPFTGWLISLYGSKKLTWLAGFVFCLIIPIIPLLSFPLLLGIVFFLLGIKTGVMDVSMNAQAVLVEEKKGKPIMSSFHAVFSAGMMLGAGCGALFVKLNSPLFTHFLVVAILCGLFIFWGRLHLLEDKREKSTSDKSSPAFRLPSRSLLGIGLIAFCCMMGEGAMADWSTIYLEKVVKSGEANAPLGLAAFSLAMMLGRFGGDWMRARMGDRRLMLIASWVAIAGLSLALGWMATTPVIVGLFFTGIGLATIVPIAYSTAGKSNELSPGAGIAMVTTIGYSGFLFGPPVIGFMADGWGLRLALGFIWILFVIMSFLSLYRLRKS